ncbi:ABC transporter ATP-binding protein [Mesorhizobium sp. A556]
MAFIEVCNVDKHYGNVRALSEVSLSIPKGSFVTLLGPSGSGKTTLLKIIAGFEGVTTGEVRLGDRNITTLKPEKRNFGVVFQGYALFPHMSVFDNVAYPLKVRRKRSREIVAKVDAILELVQLAQLARRKPHELSGGQQQRVALARALVFEPELLLLDEPMSALDKKLRVDLQDELRDIHRRLGTTFINVTHDQEEAMHMSDSIAVMDKGRIEQFDTAHHLYRNPRSRFVADFIGKSNIITGNVAKGAAGLQFVTEEFRVPMPEPDTTVAAGKADLVIRPEDIRLGPDDQAASLSGDVRLTGRIINSTYSGDRALYSLKLSGGRSMLAYGGARDGALEVGAMVALAFDTRDCILLI